MGRQSRKKQGKRCKRWEAKKPKEPSGLIGNPNKPKKPDTVTVTDTVNVIKEKRETTFRKQVSEYSKEYGQEMIDDFCDYWTESKPKGKKLKFEMQQTFDISRRLKKWSSNGFNKKQPDTDFKNFDNVQYP